MTGWGWDVELRVEKICTLAPETTQAMKKTIGDSDVVLIGPAVWQPGADGKKRYYFMVVSGNSMAKVFHIDEFNAEESDVDGIRLAVIRELSKVKRRVLVYHDELKMAEKTVAFWPVARARSILKTLRAERR